MSKKFRFSDLTLELAWEMKAKEIHDLLLSLFCRAIGFWLLFQVPLQNYFDVVGDIQGALSGDKSGRANWWDIYYLAVHILPAAYFILGAPPFLKWATRPRR